MLKFKCPYTGHVVEVKDETELPEGQVFQRVVDADKPMPAVAAAVYAPLTWQQVVCAAGGSPC